MTCSQVDQSLTYNMYSNGPFKTSLSKFFLNLEKSRTAQSKNRNITKDKKTLDVIKELIENFLTFIKNYFQQILTCPRRKLCSFLI